MKDFENLRTALEKGHTLDNDEEYLEVRLLLSEYDRLCHELSEAKVQLHRWKALRTQADI